MLIYKKSLLSIVFVVEFKFGVVVVFVMFGMFEDLVVMGVKLQLVEVLVCLFVEGVNVVIVIYWMLVDFVVLVVGIMIMFVIFEQFMVIFEVFESGEFGLDIYQEVIEELCCCGFIEDVL